MAALPLPAKTWKVPPGVCAISGWSRSARESGAAWVATGHTADDEAETVLHRLLRGTGLRGLAGIPNRRELAVDVDLVRPLLKVRRQEVLAFLEEMGQPFCLDSTNEDRRFTRSRLRHDLLPLLAAQFNPAVVDVLCRLAEQAGEAQVFVENHANALLSAAELPGAGGMVVLDVRRIAAAEPLLAREALRLLWERERLPLGEMGFEAWQSVMEVVVGELRRGPAWRRPRPPGWACRCRYRSKKNNRKGDGGAIIPRSHLRSRGNAAFGLFTRAARAFALTAKDPSGPSLLSYKVRQEAVCPTSHWRFSTICTLIAARLAVNRSRKADPPSMLMCSRASSPDPSAIADTVRQSHSFHSWQTWPSTHRIAAEQPRSPVPSPLASGRAARLHRWPRKSVATKRNE